MPGFLVHISFFKIEKQQNMYKYVRNTKAKVSLKGGVFN